MYTLTREDVQEVLVGQRTAWSVRLVVTSSDAETFPPKALVYQAETPGDPDSRGWFTAVASPAQLLEYPEDAALALPGELQQPYYRLDHVQLVSRNADSLALLVDDFFEELQLLARNITALNNLGPGQVVGTTTT